MNYDLDTLTVAIDAIRNGENTNIMVGVTTTDAELIGGWHNPNAVPIMILLSDGKYNDGVGDLQAAADTVKAH